MEQNAIEDLISKFDFKKVERYMKRRGLVWMFSNEHHTPSTTELIEKARDILKTSCRSSPCRVSYIGLHAETDYLDWNRTVPTISLFFIDSKQDVLAKDLATKSKVNFSAKKYHIVTVARTSVSYPS